MSAFLSVYELARHHRELWHQAGAFDKTRTRAESGSREYKDADAGYNKACDETDVIEDVIFDRIIVTAADAAALAVLGFSLAEAAGSPTSDQVATMKRAFANLGLFLIREANVDPDHLGSGGTNHCMRLTVGLPVRQDAERVV